MESKLREYAVLFDEVPGVRPKTENNQGYECVLEPVSASWRRSTTLHREAITDVHVGQIATLATCRMACIATLLEEGYCIGPAYGGSGYTAFMLLWGGENDQLASGDTVDDLLIAAVRAVKKGAK